MPRVSQEHKDAQRMRIQDAAMRCVARSGFDGASMASIIEEAGMSAGAVYRYYASKADLILAIAQRIMTKRLSALTAPMPDGSVPPPHVAVPRVVSSLVEEEPGPSLLVQIWGQATHDPSIAHAVHAVFSQLLDVFTEQVAAWEVQQGKDEQSARTHAHSIAPAVLALVQGAIIQAQLVGKEAGQAALEAVELLLTDDGM